MVYRIITSRPAKSDKSKFLDRPGLQEVMEEENRTDRTCFDTISLHSDTGDENEDMIDTASVSSSYNGKKSRGIIRKPF